MLKGGYMGKILRVNLTTQTYAEENTTEELASNFIGGAGLGIKYLFDEVPAGADALGQDNKLIFAPGPLTGTSAPCASRMAVVAKSPLTSAVGMCTTGGYFPAELKFAGYDALIIEGKAERPVYLWINEGKVSFRRAEKLWGTNTFDCQQLIKDELGDQNIRISCIGPAGELQSRIACIINERRAAGRKGLGAVMGAKNLKAIAVRGHKTVPVACENDYREARSRMLKTMKESPVLYSAFANTGTPMVVEATWGLGIFATRNWSATGEWNPVEKLGIKANNSRKIGKEHCYNCPVACSQLKLAREGIYTGSLSVPEFETIYAFGGQTGVDNLDSIIAADRLCDELGLDSISTGVAIGFAMELYEKEVLTKNDTDGIELNFGNHEAMFKLVSKIGYRKGFGALLADGVKCAAEKIGGNAEKYAMHVKGLELPGYDVRGAKAHGLNYATSYTGADHNRGYVFQEIFGIPEPEAVDRFAYEGKGRLTKWNQDIRTATCDCPTMCAFLLDMAFPANAAQNSADMLSSLTGLNFTPQEIEKIGERVNNLARAFNVREGFTRKDDNLPERILTEPLKEGGSKGHYISRTELEKMLDEYYYERGWSAEGVPTRRKLLDLGLKNAAEELEKMGVL
ncbi:MAG TPA: aldehyde ferredoxin oxidoreductase family protein [Thermoanaerobacterales bacterium]|nr:aldehyde ferredoxin oxidoreductase family protein [Thermoanaerobacterales bacterium]